MRVPSRRGSFAVVALVVAAACLGGAPAGDDGPGLSCAALPFASNASMRETADIPSLGALEEVIQAYQARRAGASSVDVVAYNGSQLRTADGRNVQETFTCA